MKSIAALSALVALCMAAATLTEAISPGAFMAATARRFESPPGAGARFADPAQGGGVFGSPLVDLSSPVRPHPPTLPTLGSRLNSDSVAAAASLRRFRQGPGSSSSSASRGAPTVQRPTMKRISELRKSLAELTNTAGGRHQHLPAPIPEKIMHHAVKDEILRGARYRELELDHLRTVNPRLYLQKYQQEHQLLARLRTDPRALDDVAQRTLATNRYPNYVTEHLTPQELGVRGGVGGTARGAGLSPRRLDFS